MMLYTASCDEMMRLQGKKEERGSEEDIGSEN